jgi:membrane-bound ClpP family serine protease
MAVTGVLLVFFLVLLTAAVKARRRRVLTGHEGLIGVAGMVRREIAPGATGIVLVQGELWRADAAEGRIGVDEKVVVESVEGLLLHVRRASGVIPAPRRPASPAVAKSANARA